MLANHGKSDNSSSDVLTIGNNNNMYMHSGGDDYYLPPSAERDDSSVHSGSERNDSMLGTIPEDIDDDNLGIKEYGSFAPQSKQDFSSPVSLRPPIRFPTPTVPLPPSRPPTLQSFSNNQRPSLIPSVATSQYPSSPSNTFQEFLTCEEYKRPVLLSPFEDSQFHLVDEKTKVTAKSSPPKKATTTSTSVTLKPTTTNASSLSLNPTITSNTVKTSNGTTTFEPKNNQVGSKTIFAQQRQQQQQQQQQKEDKMETDDKVKEEKKEKKEEKPKKTTKTTKKKTKKDSDSESDYVNESESDDSDKKPSKKTKKKEKIKKPTKPKPTKKETKKEEEAKKETKKETSKNTKTKKDVSIPSPKRTLDPSGSENETNGNDEPKAKKNKLSSIIDEPIAATSTSISNFTNNTSKPSVEIFAPVVKTTSQIVKEKLEARKSQSRPNEDPPKKKSETKQSLAKKQKHTADDKMKQKKSSEAISYYLRAGILFSEGAHFSREAFVVSSKETKQTYFYDAVNLLQQTVSYLKQIAKMALQHGEIQKAALTHLLLFTIVKVWFKLKSETIVKYKNYLIAKINPSIGASTGNSQSTSPAVTSPQSVSTPSPIHSSLSTESIGKEVEKLCKELEVVSQLAEQEENLNLQLKNFAVYREDAELMIRVYQGDLMFVTMFIEEELIKLDL